MVSGVSIVPSLDRCGSCGTRLRLGNHRSRSAGFRDLELGRLAAGTGTRLDPAERARPGGQLNLQAPGLLPDADGQTLGLLRGDAGVDRSLPDLDRRVAVCEISVADDDARRG